MIDLDENAAIINVLAHKPGGRLLVASRAGYGFIAPEERALALKLLQPMQGLLAAGESAEAEVVSIKEALQNFQLTLRLTLVNGRPSAWEASATATVKLGTGIAAALQGRTLEWTGKLVAPGHFALEARLE